MYKVQVWRSDRLLIGVSVILLLTNLSQTNTFNENSENGVIKVLSNWNFRFVFCSNEFVKEFNCIYSLTIRYCADRTWCVPPKINTHVHSFSYIQLKKGLRPFYKFIHHRNIRRFVIVYQTVTVSSADFKIWFANLLIQAFVYKINIREETEHSPVLNQIILWSGLRRTLESWKYAKTSKTDWFLMLSCTDKVWFDHRFQIMASIS